MIGLAELLSDAGIEPPSTLAFRHRPAEARLRRVMGWLAAEHPDMYNLYQRTHGARTEAALLRAQHVASFIGHEPGRALFVGLYRRDGQIETTPRALRERADVQRLIELGMSEADASGLDQPILFFDLRLTEHLRELSGRLEVMWPAPERSWYRWADPARNTFSMAAVHRESVFAEEMPNWDALDLSWAEISALPLRWRERLGQWRGVYLIFDNADRKMYVGSAYGGDNILGRWLNYAASGHGGNVELRKRRPETFRFAILQRTSPDLPADEVIAIEGLWKTRLHTRAPWGLNAN